MAFIEHVTRVTNPRRKRGTARRTAKGRFVKRGRVSNTRKRHTRKKKGAVIHRYTVKALKKELRSRGVKSNPGTRRRRRVAARRRAVKRSNPVLIELGAVNPRKTRRTNVAKKRKSTRRRRRSNPVARKRVYRRRRSTAVVHHRRRRRSNPVVHHRRRRHYARRRVMNRRHRNPVFGMSGGKNMLTMVAGGLVGVAATKFLPTLIPASITSGLGTNALVGVAITAAGAFAAGWLAKRFVGGAFADAVMFGGLMQAGSVLLTAFAPPSLASRLALSGLGDIMPGYFPVPQNPVTSRAVIPMPPPSAGMGAFRRAFGGQR